MKKYRILPLLLGITMIFASCGSSTGTADKNASSDNEESSSSDSSQSSTGSQSDTSAASYDGDYTSIEAPEAEEVHAADAQDQKTEITGEFSITSEDADVSTAVSVDGSVYTITAAGEYVLSGKLEEGQIIIAAGEEDEVTLDLNGVSITCSTGSPICAFSADKVKIKSEEDTYNEIIDARQQKTAADSSSSNTAGSISSAEDEEDGDSGDSSEDISDTNRNAAIYAKTDLSLTGKGVLVVTGGYNNGIQTSKDLKIKNVTLKVTAANNALKGNDSVTIESGEIIAIAQGGDGIKTTDSDVSSKGNQRGIVSIEGGNIDIYAACDGIDAAYDADVSGEGNLNIYTDSYSDYSEGAILSEDSVFYLILSSSDYSEDCDYYAYYYNEESDEGCWAKAEYSTMVYSGRTAYYGLSLSAVSGYDCVAFYIFESGAEPSADSSSSACQAVSDGDSVNTEKNGYLFSSISGGAISGDWVSLSSGNGSANSDKSEYSTKGIKADNEVVIDGMTINIYCKDDGIHANSDKALDTSDSETSGSSEDDSSAASSSGVTYGTGNVTINSGTITITAADDGIHADNELTINGGSVNVVSSYEGLEGNLITINSGCVWAYASDDAVNACAGNSTPLVSVNGGYLQVTTPSGDTDAIDSNGNYEQTGGYVIVRGGASTGSMAGSIDVDGSISVTGGAVIAVGGICETPQNSCNAYAESRTSMAEGSYELQDSDGNVVLAFELDTTYSSFWVCSENLEEGTDYTLTCDGTSVSEWTQEEGTMGSSGSGFGGMGQQGGFGGRK